MMGTLIFFLLSRLHYVGVCAMVGLAVSSVCALGHEVASSPEQSQPRIAFDQVRRVNHGRSV
jgi:hypothetical protein